MFTTFVGAPLQAPRRRERAGGSPSPARPKRSQVSRACDWCRAHRIKCDSNYPCHNCQSRGSPCSNKGVGEVRTLPHALREIERLRTRVQELEELLASRDSSLQNVVVEQSHLASPASSSSATSHTPPAATPSAPAVLDPLQDHGVNKKYWEGIHTSTTQSQQTQCYGPASPFYFIGRMSAYLGSVLQQPHLVHSMQPNSASKSFASPTSPRKGDLEDHLMSENVPMTGDYLTATQEDYFLGLFWQSYHPALQFIDESEFKQHYKSLWTSPGKSRKSSALVDIVLAICMQYGIAFLPRVNPSADPKADFDSNDATIAGRWFYRRCQALLNWELESPSISTLQCQLITVIYLCNASFQNMAHSTLALAVRTAQILGLHLEPPEDMPRAQRELRKRLWWTLYTIEVKTCMKLGRPWAIQLPQVTCSLPADDHELTLISGSNFASCGENTTWHTYTVLNAKLVLTVQAVYSAFYEKCADVLGSIDANSLYSDHQSLEICAQFLLSKLQCLQSWEQRVPNALKTQRKGTGRPFSTDRSALDVELFAPLWLQRQRLILELLYHNLSLNLYRPFICFGSKSISDSSTPAVVENAHSCVNHAMSITHIIHQVLSESDILTGWHEAFIWQWNSTPAMIGFVLAYPFSPLTPSVRNAINLAIGVFDMFGKHLAVAESAGNVTRNLISQVDLLNDRRRSNLNRSNELATSDSNALQSYSDPNQINATFNPRSSPQLDEESAALLQNTLAGSMGLAFMVDSFNSFEPLNPDLNNLSDTWTFELS